ncbi:MAG: 2-oxoacid:acceptor oxidoreductase subunit alpha [bacterium]
MAPETALAGGGTTGVPVRVDGHIVEIVSDSGEGAQKAGQIFGAVSAKMGNGVWTVEIIPAEIKPPARSRAGASGIRIRLGSSEVTNMGDEADLVVAFNEQVLYGRIEQHAYKPGTILLLDCKWATDPVESVREMYAKAIEEFKSLGLVIHEIPIEEECGKITDTPRVGKNMWVVGLLARVYGRELEKVLSEVEIVFRRKGEAVVKKNHDLVRAGWEFAERELPYQFEVPAWCSDRPMVVMNGNQAVGLGVMASGMECLAMYPITPATSASHYLAAAFPRVGGFLHQAEDEIAAIGFAVGAAYAGKTSCTITSGPGLALKTEFIGLTVMAEIPIVIVIVQRGGPSTGLPTKVEQGELLPTIFGAPGDDPKIVFAAATIEECYQFVITARELAEQFRGPVILLTDANLATGVAPFPRPELSVESMAADIDPSPWPVGVPPYDWDPDTGLSPRPVPGQPGGEYVLTGLAHTRFGKVAYDPNANQIGCEMRSRKLAALRHTLRPPVIRGEEEGDLLIVGWGSTLGAIDEAVERARREGHSVSSVHLRFLSPLEPGLTEIFSRFRQVLSVEINYSDPVESPPLIRKETRRLSQLARLLRTRTLVDVDSWSNVHGQPLRPGEIYAEIVKRCEALREVVR